jgi:hypothetical protein
MKTKPDGIVEDEIDLTQIYLPKLWEYSLLALKQEPREEEANRLEAIYTEAEADSVLNFFITKLDQLLAERLDLLDAETINRHGNQQALLREHLVQSLFDQEYRSEIQELLKNQGYYKGPIDGILGQRSWAALREFRKSLQKQLKEQGFYNGQIDGELGERSVTAVLEFQKSRDLYRDGVPGPKTFVFFTHLDPPAKL